MPKKKETGKPIEQYEHRDKDRANIPPVGLVTPKTDPDKDKPASSRVGPDGMTDYARKRKAKIEAGKKKTAALAKKRAEAKKKRESGEYKGPSGRAGDFNFLGIKGNVKRYGEGG